MSQINKYTKDKSLLYKNKTARSIDIWYYYIYGWELGKPIGAKIKLENILIKVKLRWLSNRSIKQSTEWI